jgi:lipoteichoic acid synthase
MQEALNNLPVNSLKINTAKLLKGFFFYITFLSIFIKSLAVLGYVHKISLSNKALTFGGILVYSSFIFILLAFAFLFKNRARIWFLIILNISISILFVMDLWYFRSYGNLASVHLIKETANLENLSDSILSMSRLKDAAFLIDILPLMAIAFLFRNSMIEAKRSLKLFFILFFASALYITAVSLVIDVKKAIPNQTFFFTSWVPTRTVNQLSPLGYHYLDLFLFIVDSHHITLSKSQKNDISTWFKDKKENLPDNKYKSIFKGKNLIMIQVESLENFVINQKINGQEVTPNLNKILKNSIYFSNFYEQINNGGSTDADLMSNTSVYPVRIGSTFFRYPDNTYNSLPKLLIKQGYGTIAIHPDRAAYWNWMPSLKAIGFQKCIDSEFFNKTEEIGLGISDGSFLRQVEPIIKVQKQPFYSFIVTLTSHSPFNLPGKYRELALDSKLDRTKLGGYFQSVHYTDKQIGTLLNKLDSDKLLDNSVVVVYGDHCGIHRYYKDEIKNIKPWEDWWLKTNEEIPFIIYQKNMTGEENKEIAGQIDILPTLAYTLGIDEEKLENTAMGRNLFNTKKNFAVTAKGVYIGDTKNTKEKENEIKGLKIADSIIQSNYFKNVK